MSAKSLDLECLLKRDLLLGLWIKHQLPFSWSSITKGAGGSRASNNFPQFGPPSGPSARPGEMYLLPQDTLPGPCHCLSGADTPSCPISHHLQAFHCRNSFREFCAYRLEGRVLLSTLSVSCRDWAPLGNPHSGWPESFVHQQISFTVCPSACPSLQPQPLLLWATAHQQASGRAPDHLKSISNTDAWAAPRPTASEQPGSEAQTSGLFITLQAILTCGLTHRLFHILLNSASSCRNFS